MDNIWVSVIVPVYNTQNYLKECLDSILNQTLKEIEIICIDNGSTDNSKEILNYYERKYKNIIVLTHPEGRQGGARNAGIRRAKGKYISFVDSDDIIASCMFENMIDLAERNIVNIVMCQKINFRDGEIVRFLSNDKLITNYKCLTPNMLAQLFDSLVPWNKIFSTKFIKENKLLFLEDTFYEDQYFVAKSYLLSSNITITSEVLYYYRKQRKGSVTNTSNSNWIELFNVWKIIMRDFSYLLSADILSSFMVKRVFELFNTLNLNEQKAIFNYLKQAIIGTSINSQFLNKKEKVFLIFVSKLNLRFYRYFLDLIEIAGQVKLRLIYLKSINK